MAEAFIAFIRYEQELLMLRRSKSDGDYPSLWDGVYGIGDSPEEYIARVVECTGIPVEDWTYVRDGPALGIDVGNRLLDVKPIIIVSASKEVEPAGRYSEAEWIDPGEIQNRNTVFTNLQVENSEKLFRDMYGSVASFLYIVKTAIGSEQRVANEMQARMFGSGSLSALSTEVYGILHPPGMRGYVMVESSALHHVEKLIGRSGGRDPKARRGLNQTQLKNAKTVLPGSAKVKIDFRLVPNMDPKKLIKLLQRHLRVNGFNDISINVLNAESAARTNPNEKIVNTVCESTKKIFGDYVLNISNAGTGPMHAFTNILSVPCISVGASYIFCRMHSPNEFAKIDLLHKTTKNICVLLEKFSRS